MPKAQRSVTLSAVFLGITALVAGSDAHAEGQTDEAGPALTATLSYDYTSGNYGTAYRLPAATTSVGISWNIGENWILDVELPYLRQTTTINTANTTASRVVRIGGKPVVIKGTTTVATNLTTISGQGDVTALLTRSFDSGAGPVWSVGSMVKFATANASNGLGTGKQDPSIQAGVVNDLGPWTLGATLGYTLVGQVEGLNLRNVQYAEFDSSYAISPLASIGLSLSMSQAPISGGPAPLAASLSYDYKFAKKMHFVISGLRGFSDGSPKWGAGLAVSAAF